MHGDTPESVAMVFSNENGLDSVGYSFVKQNLYEKLRLVKNENKAPLSDWKALELQSDPLSEANLLIVNTISDLDENTQKFALQQITECMDLKGNYEFQNDKTVTKKKKKKSKKQTKANTIKSTNKQKINQIAKPADIPQSTQRYDSTDRQYKSKNTHPLMFYEESYEEI